jgi:macrocin-O-methyltransferase TylF-like protien
MTLLVPRLHSAYVDFATWINLPVSFSSFFRTSCGDVGLLTKLGLLRKMRRNNKAIPSASHFLEHLVIATRILEIPRSITGCVVECGTYKGGSAANLSLVCALAGRQLEVFDSFEGLPIPGERDQAHLVLDRSQIHTYKQGDWCGTIDEVRENIARYGNARVVSLHSGYFEDTLPLLDKECVAAFADVDLVSSLKTCLKHLWPLLCQGGYMFTHEARHLEISALFFDQAWWHDNFTCNAPGLIGAGSGLGLLPSGTGFCSDLAYAVKGPGALTENPQTGATRDS